MRKARELDDLADPARAPIPLDALPRALADRYQTDHLPTLSVRHREKHTYLLTRWTLQLLLSNPDDGLERP